MEENLTFKDKVVIVTGGSSGIGAETAKTFSAYGAKLTLVGRNSPRLLSTAQNCQQNGVLPVCVLVDLTQAGSCEIVTKKTIEAYGRIDVLVNCAGVAAMSSAFDQSIETFDEMMAINLRVPIRLTQLTLPHLMKTKGCIVNIGFSMTNKFRPGFLIYNIAKTALERFTKQAAPELMSEGVRINIVTPGMTRTNILSNLDMDPAMQQLMYEDVKNLLPCGRILEPKEVARYICLVASDTFPKLNGASLVIDGAASLA